MYPEQQYALAGNTSAPCRTGGADAARRQRPPAGAHVKGKSLTEIGEEMLISVKTVSTHRTHILGKLGLSSNAKLVLYAVRQGLIH